MTTPASGLINGALRKPVPPKQPGVEEQPPLAGATLPAKPQNPRYVPPEPPVQTGGGHPLEPPRLDPELAPPPTGGPHPIENPPNEPPPIAMPEGRGGLPAGAQTMTAGRTGTATPQPVPTPGTMQTAPAGTVRGAGQPPQAGTGPGAPPPVQTATAGTPQSTAVQTGGGEPLTPAAPAGVPARRGIINGATTASPAGATTATTQATSQTQAPNATTSTPAPLAASSTPPANRVAGGYVPPKPVDPNAPVTREVGANETVQGQIKALIEAGNPLLEGAKARAMQYASSRGLVNSSIASQGGEEALLHEAVPIATADAGTYSRQALANQDIQNQSVARNQTIAAQERMANADNATRGGIAAAQAQAMLSASAADNATRLTISANDLAGRERMLQTEMDQRWNLANLDVNARTHIAEIDINSRRDLNMSSLQQNTLTNYGGQIAQIQANPNLSTSDKETAIRNLNAIYGGSPYLPITINWGATSAPAGNPAARRA